MPARLPAAVKVHRDAAEAAWNEYKRHRNGCGQCTTCTAGRETSGLCDTGFRQYRIWTREGNAERRERERIAAGAVAVATLF